MTTRTSTNMLLDRASSTRRRILRTSLLVLVLMATCAPFQRGGVFVTAQDDQDYDSIGSWWTQDEFTTTPEEDPPVRADIVGGDPAAAGRFPAYAIPDFGNGLCGSVLIAPDVLLTAAHCGGVFRDKTP